MKRKGARLAVCLLAVLALGRPQCMAAAAWQWQKTTVPLALVVDGLWGEYFRVSEALDRVGFRRRDALSDLPKHTVIVLINASAMRFPKGMLGRIQEFVRHGGGLVVLGGLCAYSNGAYGGTPLEEVLPVSIEQSYCGHLFPTAEKGVKLAPVRSAAWPVNFDFQPGPTAYFLHKLIPKDEAWVQLRVGREPALVSGAFGTGRVVACALAVNGDPAPGVMPFWDWEDWPKLLGETIRWAGKARPIGEVVGRTDVDAPKPLTEDELESAEMDLTDLPENFVARAMATPDERAATVLLELAAPDEGEEAKCALDTVLPALLPYARPEWGEKLNALADDLNPNIKTRRAALILLGASRGPLAYPVLTKALKIERTELAAMDGLGRLDNRDAIPLLRRRFEEVLAPAKLPDGPDRWKPVEFTAASRPAAHAAIALYRLGDPEGVARLCSFAGNLNLYRRIMWNATKRWPRDPQGQAILKGIISRAHTLQQAWDFLVRNVGPIPASQGKAFVTYAAAASDPIIVELLVGAMEESVGKLPNADWQTLSAAKSGIVARMSKAVIRSDE